MCFRSETVDDGAGFDPHRFGNAKEGMQADPLFAPLNFAYINWVQIGFLSQLFLCQTCLFPVLTDGFTN